MDLQLKGKNFLVTGVGSGIGRAVAKALVSYGGEVYGVSRTQAHLDALKLECPEIHIYCQDVAKWDEYEALLESLPTMAGLVNNAGVSQVDPCVDVEEKTLDWIFGINIKACIHTAQSVARKMAKDGVSGSIVNVSSMVSSVGLVNHVGYCASKGALDQATRVMAIEWGPKNIRTNSVCPTVVMTEMGKKIWCDPVEVKAMKEKIPLGKFAEEEDVVNPILFLLSSKAGMVNGISMPIDGGYTAC